MKEILISGSSGFVGSNFIKKYKGIFQIIEFNRSNTINIKFDSINTVIHLAGLSKDTKEKSNPSLYYEANVSLTQKIYDAFLLSDAEKFIYFSSIKACCDSSEELITEETICSPITDYGKSKLMAEQYLKSIDLPENKKLYILRPCMVHGPGNKGNLNSLFKFVSKGIPWPLGAIENRRSFCSIDNLMFVLNEIITRDDIPSGIYNIADDDYLSTNDLIRLIATTTGKSSIILNLPKFIFKFLIKLGDLIRISFISESLNKLSETSLVSNEKIKKVINKRLPMTTREGILKTFQSFNNND